jgi:VWFA-related protein
MAARQKAKAQATNRGGTPAMQRTKSILITLGLAIGTTALTGAAPAQAAPPQVQTAPSPTGQPQYTIRARVPLTIVDVTVTDAKGRPVHNLKQSDFTLLEDNHEMQPNSFEEHRADTASEPTPALPQQSLPPNTFANTTPTPGSGPLNILLLDNLNTPLSNQRILQKHMIEFVDKLPVNSRVAVFNLSEFHLSILQGFTTDRELLKAAINSKKVTGQIPPIEDLWQDEMNLMDKESSDPEEQECNHAALRAQDSLTAMKQIARYLSGLPGRKNLLWFSGSFPLQMDAHSTNCYDVTDELKAADDLLARAHVIIFPADPRAMDAMTEPLPHQAVVIQRQAIEHLTMEAIAEQTGGKPYYNNNALDAFAEDALDTGSNFYTLTYTPANQTLDTRFRTITVKVSQPGLHLVYRNGYYAVDPDTDTRGKKIETVTPMQSAMMRGSLPATQILFRVKVVEFSTPDTTPAAENQPDPKQMKPPYRRYSINYLIDVHGIDFAPASDGNYRGDFEYGVRVYNADGDEILNSTSKTVSPILLPAVYRSMLNTGANAHRDIDVPATGDYFLRIAVHDLTTNRVGSIEIPTSSITPAGAP